MSTETRDDDAEAGTIAAAHARLAERLFESRSVLIHGEITSQLAQSVSAQLIALAAGGNNEITIYVHSQGGHVEAGDTIHDMIRFIDNPVRVVGTGWVASAGVIVYLAVPKERRFSLPNTRFLLHQPRGGTVGQATDIGIEAAEILKIRQRLNEIIARETGQSVEKIAQDSERNFWMSAEEALEYGIVGRIVASMADL